MCIVLYILLIFTPILNDNFYSNTQAEGVNAIIIKESIKHHGEHNRPKKFC